MLLIQRSSDTPIRPKDIDIDTSFFNTFGQREAEVSAYWVVRYCQARRTWRPFRFDRLVKFVLFYDPRWSKAENELSEGLSTLIIAGFVTTEKRVITLTTAFVARCYETSPIPGLPRKRKPPRPKVTPRSRLDVLMDDEDLV